MKKERKLTDNEKKLWENAMNCDLFQCIIPSQVELYESTVDLHGMTVNDAYKEVLSYIDKNHKVMKSMCFITGKSGQINSEFVKWIDANQKIREIVPKNGGGAFQIFFKKT